MELDTLFTVTIRRVTRGHFGKKITGISQQFFVSGRPIPQGSLKFIRGNAIHVRAKDLGLWRADIAKVARSIILERAQYGVELSLVFTLNKPKTVTRLEPFKRPDIDKLCRAVLDALTGVAYEDDQQVTKLTAVKEYGETEGVTIRITDKEKLRLSLLNAEIVIDGILRD
jgi:crossover junction endodeoxyribonuclease RusA